MYASRLNMWRRKVAAEKEGDVGHWERNEGAQGEIWSDKRDGYRVDEISIRSMPMSACRNGRCGFVKSSTGGRMRREAESESTQQTSQKLGSSLHLRHDNATA